MLKSPLQQSSASTEQITDQKFPLGASAIVYWYYHCVLRKAAKEKLEKQVQLERQLSRLANRRYRWLSVADVCVC